MRQQAACVCVDKPSQNRASFHRPIKPLKPAPSKALRRFHAHFHPHSSEKTQNIFLQELETNGLDVMVHLDDRYPMTHGWIPKYALSWSRRKLAEQVPHGPERAATLRAAARERYLLAESERDRQHRAMSTIGGETVHTTSCPVHNYQSEEVFEDLAGELMI